MKSVQLAALMLSLLLVGCGKEKEKRAWSFMPNMHHQESVRAYEPEHDVPDIEARKGSAMREPIEGTVPRDFVHYTTGKMSPDAKQDINPLPMTMDILKAGRRSYNIYCLVCHGERGDGDGHIIPDPDNPGYSHSGREYLSQMQMPPPPPLSSDRIGAWSDGEIFNYITRGGALMPKYDHLSAEVRWSIVNYVRVLYKASRATEEDVAEYESLGEKVEDPSPSSVIHEWR